MASPLDEVSMLLAEMDIVPVATNSLARFIMYCTCQYPSLWYCLSYSLAFKTLSSHRILRRPTKCPSDFFSRLPLAPDILTIRPTLQNSLLFAVPILHYALLDVLATPTVLGTHAEPKVIPVI